MFTPFANEPLTQFNDDASRGKMEDALKYVSGKLGASVSMVIGGDKVESTHTFASLNPANTSTNIGHVHEATTDHAELAVQAAVAAFPGWSRTSPEMRARILVKAAAVLRRKIHEFSAWMVYEAGKSWVEAYADAAEAVDFLEFYAREAVRLGGSHPTTGYPGEENEVFYQPLGVGAVISPWNFPLAIMAGMTASAVVAGNTVVVKPAEQTPVVAMKFMDLLEQAGLPPGVANFINGPGEIVGEYLTGHKHVAFVSFTGSRDVGLHIYERVATHQPGQRHIRRAVLEMGGKDAIVVDDGVNIDGTAAEVVQSAFGFQGQKCSACSRLIAHSRVYDALVAKVVERASKIRVGDPAVQANFMGPVIDDEAYRKVREYIAIGRGEGTLLLGGNDAERDHGPGFFIHPCIFGGVDRNARIAQEEIFGPVLACIRADSFEDALDIANDTDYGLTGSVFSYNRAHLEMARREFAVGNLYLNRKCTGALVAVQPFGGFKLSGTDSKAGGRDYLLHFMNAKSVAERF